MYIYTQSNITQLHIIIIIIILLLLYIDVTVQLNIVNTSHYHNDGLFKLSKVFS